MYHHVNELFTRRSKIFEVGGWAHVVLLTITYKVYQKQYHPSKPISARYYCVS